MGRWCLGGSRSPLGKMYKASRSGRFRDRIGQRHLGSPAEQEGTESQWEQSLPLRRHSVLLLIKGSKVASLDSSCNCGSKSLHYVGEGPLCCQILTSDHRGIEGHPQNTAQDRHGSGRSSARKISPLLVEAMMSVIHGLHRVQQHGPARSSTSRPGKDGNDAWE